MEKVVCDLYENSSDVVQLNRFLKARSQRPAKVDELCNTLSLVDSLKDVDISLLQDLLGLGSKKVESILIKIVNRTGLTANRQNKSE